MMNNMRLEVVRFRNGLAGRTRGLRHAWYGTAMALGIWMLPSAVAAQSCPGSGNDSVASLARSWILEGWEKKVGDPPFVFKQKLGRYYSASVRADEGVFYDDFDTQHRIVRQPADYGAIWEGPFNSLKSVRHAIALGPLVVSSGDLAVSTLQFLARIDTGSDVVGIRTLSTLTWRCTRDGWGIIREHNSSQMVPKDQIDAAIKAAGG